ncbi:MAG TPA: SDR family NAD(P)-dependent oxidoreductase [Gaiellaceae bacterium]|nr:SDR family NAD(P)-dependent oxidoreductase [Gaiellaceae bacterium]
MEKSPQTRYVLVTGGSSGIGAATVRELSHRGYRVIATYRAPHARAALEMLPNVSPVQIDLSDPESISEAVAAIDDLVADNGLYALINNAGITYTAPFEYAQPERVREIIDVNLIAPFLLTQACIPLLERHNASASPKARVINVASWAGLMAAPFIGFYNATKYGLIGLTESMSYDLRPAGIHVVLANPGITKTPMHGKTTSAALSSLEAMPAEGRERYGAYLEHFATMGEASDGSRLLATADKVGARIADIVDKSKPRYRYNLASDARLIDLVVTRLIPFSVRAAANRRMYRLDKPATHAPASPATAAVSSQAAAAPPHGPTPLRFE